MYHKRDCTIILKKNFTVRLYHSKPPSARRGRRPRSIARTTHRSHAPATAVVSQPAAARAAQAPKHESMITRITAKSCPRVQQTRRRHSAPTPDRTRDRSHGRNPVSNQVIIASRRRAAVRTAARTTTRHQSTAPPRAARHARPAAPRRKRCGRAGRGSRSSSPHRTAPPAAARAVSLSAAL
jgi:hypothetical protein